MLNDINKMAVHQLAIAVKNNQVSREDVVASRHHNTVRAMDRILDDVKRAKEEEEEARKEYEASTTKEERLRDCLELAKKAMS